MEAKILYKENILSANLIVAKETSKTFAILLSGGSKKIGQERYAEFQALLQQQGVSSLAFDYAGSGRSEGVFDDSSLADRIEQTAFLYSWLCKQYGENITIYLCGASMGAYVAVGAANKIGAPVSKLMLVCSAAYSQNAHAVNFGPAFSQEIRRPESWKNSLAFQWIEEYKGELLIIAGEQDDIIPKEIPQTYLESAVRAASKNLAIIPQAKHTIAAFNLLQEPDKSQVLKLVLDFFKA